MSSVKDKLDNLIFTVAKLADKIENFDKRFDESESKFDQQYLKLKKESEGKIARLTARVEKLETLVIESEKSAIMKENYSKRMNILIHGVEEETDSPWETHDQTRAIFENFLAEAVKIDPAQVDNANVHRLPQSPVYRYGHKKTRPIIVKLVHAKDKSQIFAHLKI